MGTRDYYFELWDLEDFEDIVSVFVGRLASYFARRFILSVYLDDSIPANCYYLWTFIVRVDANYVGDFFEFFFGFFFFFLVIFREIM